ncbi:MAG TPA: NAD(+)/NADH kinase [Candidatus Polarisedimenticolia bacterium]|jgi:NAD+ kinase|nr:NAD(+)/NADH kinase [Candidatus Polarisedimenticolia bacterium]
MAAETRPHRITSVTIVAKLRAPEARGAARRCARFLDRRGIAVSFDPETARVLGRRKDARALGGALAPADLCVVIGGDGTLLMAARALASRPRPILGVNLGGLGFLTETGPDEMEKVLADILAGRYELDRRIGLEVNVVRGGRTIMRRSTLNDAVINKSALARIIEIDLSIDREPVTTYKSDGLIISTPTGSTAYSLSAGGPIVHPNLEAFLITPICPHTLSLRPLVVPDRSIAELSLRAGDSEVYLTLDGQVGHPLKKKDRVRVRRSRQPILMVRSPRRSYFEVLRQKLHWGER